MTEQKLVVEGIRKAYGSLFALDDVSLEVKSGEFLTVLGPSGSGKTTLLQVVSGLVAPTAGRLRIDGADVTDMPASQRGIGVVFQNYALFPHLTVKENIAFPLLMRRRPYAEIERKSRAALELVELGELGNRFPQQLSGGQQQRVALARCLVYEPALILMDEPLGALDRKLRETMQIEIKRLHRETGATIMFVTHDQEEALALSDRICLMNHAKIVQLATPDEIYNKPNSVFAADFIGVSNILSGTVDEYGRLASEIGAFPLPKGADAKSGMKGALVVRPEHVTLGAGDGYGSGVVVETIYAGFESRVVIKTTQDKEIIARLQSGQKTFSIGDQIGFGWDTNHTVFIEGKNT